MAVEQFTDIVFFCENYSLNCVEMSCVHGHFGSLHGVENVKFCNKLSAV